MKKKEWSRAKGTGTSSSGLNEAEEQNQGRSNTQKEGAGGGLSPDENRLEDSHEFQRVKPRATWGILHRGKRWSLQQLSIHGGHPRIPSIVELESLLPVLAANALKSESPHNRKPNGKFQARIMVRVADLARPQPLSGHRCPHSLVDEGLGLFASDASGSQLRPFGHRKDPCWIPPSCMANPGCICLSLSDL